MEQEGFTYYAFISYSHKDQEIAKELKQFLEKYNLPSNLQKSHPSLPKKFSPIFIDESNLAGPGPLQKNLCENLEASKYLIVICSPNSAQSWYVNNEVNYFINTLHRVDRIIPLIVDGTPHSEDPDTECFPPAILALDRELEPLGIDVKTHRKRNAFLRVIAALLNLKPGKFIPWIERERRKKIALISSLAASLLIAAGLFVWHTFIPHHRYYHTYAYKWGKPVGLFEVKSESDRMKMEYTYRFTTLRGKVQMIERVNSAGILTDPVVPEAANELPMIRFVSDRTAEYYDQYGHKIYRTEYTKNMQAVDFYCGDSDIPYALPSDSGKKITYNPDLDLGQKSSNIIRKTLEYDENGYIVKEMFRRDNHGGRDKKGTPARDKNGIWGFSYSRDSLGRIISLHVLDKNGDAMTIRGVYAMQSEYGDSPYPVKISAVGKDGKITSGTQDFALVAISYDEYCNVEKISYYDADGKPALNENVSVKVYAYGKDNGFPASVSYYDTNMNPCLCEEGYFRQETIRSKEGRGVKIICCDTRGERTICSEGYAGGRVSYNDSGQMTSIAFMDTENKPISCTDAGNVYGWKYSYEDGLLKRIDNIDAEGNLMTGKDGYASIIQEYDKEENKVSKLIFLDTEGKKALTSNGIAEMRLTYDDGNISGIEYYDENGLPRAGIAKIVQGWKDGNCISVKIFDGKGRLTHNNKGYAVQEHEYDENGLKIWDRYYDAEGKRTMRSNGYSAVRYDYDSGGKNITRITYYDAEDHYAVQTDAYYCYAKEYEYDDSGEISRITFIREENSPYHDMLDKQVKDIYISHDKHGNEIMRYWLNGKGEEVDSEGKPSGLVIREREYDIYRRLRKEYWYGRGEEKARGFTEYDYDSFGRVISTNIVKDTGNILAAKKEYDVYGRCIREYYLDGRNKLIIPNGKFYAVKKSKYDIFGHETDIWYYDGKEEPIRRKDQAFHTVRTFDARGNILTESYYSYEGKEEKPAEILKTYYNNNNEDFPMKLSCKFHKIVRKYDALRREAELWLYNADGRPVQNTSCHIVRTYNELGKVTSFQAYDSEGKPFLGGDIAAFKTVFAYDAYGNISDIWCFDADNSPCQFIRNGKATGIHHFKFTHNAMGKPLSGELFDTEEKPLSVRGVHKILNIYDSYGLMSEQAGYNEKQQLVKRKLYKYDADGNEIEEERVE